MRAAERSLRSHLWQLAERRRYLAGLEALAASLDGDVMRLREEAERAEDGDAREAALAGREIVARSIAEVESQLAAARAAVAEAAVAVKRHDRAGGGATRPRRQRRRGTSPRPPA